MKIPPVKIIFSQEDRRDIFERFNDIFNTGQFTLGKYGKELEDRWAAYQKTKHAITVNSGTASLELPLRALNVENGEVIIPTNTFIATGSAVMHSKAKPVLADIDDSFCMNPASLKDKISKNTKAVVYVHIGGYISRNVEKVKKICDDNNLPLIEDAAQAHGAAINGKYAGTFGLAGSFSLYPTKIITSGEGGIIVSNDDKINEKTRIFRDQGKASFFSADFIEFGHNFRMSEFHAAIGLSHFKKMDGFIKERNQIARKYDSKLRKLSGVKPFKIEEGSINNFYKYIVLLDKDVDRARVKKELKEKFEVGLSGEVYEKPLHMQGAFRDFKFKQGEFKNSEVLCTSHICLPVYNTMTEEVIEYVVDSLKQVI